METWPAMMSQDGLRWPLSVDQDSHCTECVRSIYLSDVSNDPGREHPKYSPLNRGKDEGQRGKQPSWSTQPMHGRNKTQITMFIWYLHQIYNCTKVKCPQTFPSTSPLRQRVLGRLGVSNKKLGIMWHEEAGLSGPQAGSESHKNEPLMGTSAC